MRSVLIVDDDPDIREAISEALSGEGYSVIEAMDGQDALDILEATRIEPCIVLLDMMMPRMTGNEFLHAIAKSPKLAALPIIVVSAYAGPIEPGARRVIAKPLHLQTLLNVVAEFCQCAETSRRSFGARGEAMGPSSQKSCKPSP